MLNISYLISCTGLTIPPSAGLLSSSSSAFNQLLAVTLQCSISSCKALELHTHQQALQQCLLLQPSSNCLGNAWDELKGLNSSLFSVALQIAFSGVHMCCNQLELKVPINKSTQFCKEVHAVHGKQKQCTHCSAYKQTGTANTNTDLERKVLTEVHAACGRMSPVHTMFHEYKCMQSCTDSHTHIHCK